MDKQTIIYPNEKKLSLVIHEPINSENNITPKSTRSHKLNNCASNDLLYKDFRSFKTTGSTEVTYQMISDILRNTYNFEESITSTALDILGLYLKGQKILYTEAKTLCEKRLHTLMLPAIFISAISIVLSLLLNTYVVGSIILSILSVINSFILSLVTYLKLDAKAEAHKSSAYKYQKLESLCEFKSGKVLIFKNVDDVSDILNEIETKVMEIKESNQFILPEFIRHSYPVIYSTNVFNLVKKIQNNEIILINNLKLIIKKILEKSKEKHILENTITINDTHTLNNNNMANLIKTELDSLENDKNNAFNDVINFREKYLEIDKIFNDEINQQRLIMTECTNCCNWLKT
jgi:hypothetical protein